MSTRLSLALAGLMLASVFASSQTATHPTLAYSTYLSGDDNTQILASTADANGYQYVLGWTAAADFPTTSNAYRRTPSPATTCEIKGECQFQTMFVTKFNRDGSALVYSTFIANAAPVSIAIDNSGNVYGLAARTTGGDMTATPGAWQTNCTNYCYFLFKLNSSGSSLVYSTYLQGTNDCEQYAGVRGTIGTGNPQVAVDSTSHAHVVLTATSHCFTTPGAFKPTMLSGQNAMVMKFKADASGLIYSTYVGGYNYGAADEGATIAVDSNDHAIIAGSTGSSDFPTSGHAFQRTRKGSADAFVAKLSADGSTLLAATLLGGSSTVDPNDPYAFSSASSLAVDSLNYVYVAGRTLAKDFPVTPTAPEHAPDPGLCGPPGDQGPCGDDFLAKLPLDFSQLIYSTFLGGPNGEEFYPTVAVDRVGHAFVDGISDSAEVPLVKPTSSTGEAWLAELNTSGTQFLFSTRYGNSASPTGIGVDLASNAYAAGSTRADLPTTAHAYQTTDMSADGEAGFAAKWDIPPCTLSSTNRTVTVCTPPNNSTVPRQMLLSAGATDTTNVAAMKVYVDGTSVFSINASHFNTYVNLSSGTHHITVKAWDDTGSFSKMITVTAQ